jgi:hypothetical protein
MSNVQWDNSPTRPGLESTDRERWTNSGRYDPGWSFTANVAAAMVPRTKWLCDIGCGPFQFLRTVRPDVVYLPADIHAWTNDTEVCDLNKGELPRGALALCDVVFLLGVVEYVYDPRALFRALRHVERMVVTYNPIDTVPRGRKEVGWLSALSKDELVSAIIMAGFDIETLTPHSDKTTSIYISAVNRNFGRFRRGLREMRRFRFRLGRSQRSGAWRLGPDE